MRARWVAGLGSLVAVAMASEARAHQVCVDLPLGLADASPTAFTPSDLGEHHGRADAYSGDRPFRAQHWLVRVIAESATDPSDVGTILWGYEPLDTNGCTGEFDPLSATEFRVAYAPWAYWASSGNSVVALDCNAMPNCSFEADTDTIVQVGGGSETALTLPDPAGATDRLHEYVLWSISFAENHRSYFSDTSVYVSYDDSQVVVPGTGANRRVGGQPAVLAKGGAHEWKFIMGHEFGHVVSILVPIPNLVGTEIDCSYDQPDHKFSYPEYQSCAAPEGMAHLYTLSTWYDIELTSGSIDYAIGNYTPPISQVGGATFCNGGGGACPPGFAIERDWASALVNLYRHPDGPSLETILYDASAMQHGMLDAAHPWTSVVATSDWWDDFDMAMSSYLSPAEYAAWTQVYPAWEIDQ